MENLRIHELINEKYKFDQRILNICKKHFMNKYWECCDYFNDEFEGKLWDVVNNIEFIANEY